MGLGSTVKLRDQLLEQYGVKGQGDGGECCRRRRHGCQFVGRRCFNPVGGSWAYIPCLPCCCAEDDSVQAEMKRALAEAAAQADGMGARAEL